jgi:hypothetical protein
MMERKRPEKPSHRQKMYQRRLRRWWLIGSGVVAALYAIDPNWPLNLRRLVVIIVTWIRGSPGSYRP